ncbi:MAG: phosphate ABC transporter permease subunit PstC [Thermoplasmata archaeon]
MALKFKLMKFFKSIRREPVRGLLFFSSFISIIFLFLMLVFILKEGAQSLLMFGVGFIIGPVWETNSDLYGAFPLIYGSLMIVVGALAIAVPLALGTSVFISEIVPFSIRDILKSMIELLASIPSVIYGFIGILVVAPFIASLFSIPSGTVALTAAIILAIMTIPTIVGVSSEIISAVPKDYKEAALALGATKWQTIRHVVLPTAKSGVIAGILLGFGRAIGETVAVVMVAGNTAIIPSPPWNFLSPVYTLTGAIAMQMGEASVGSLEYSALFGLGLILFIITFIVNTLADIIINKGSKKGAKK